jgi:hypothetical protein
VAVRVRSTHVFINCPFDPIYTPLFNAIVFTILRFGFCAAVCTGLDDSAEVRLSKIERIIEECKFGIHDISAVTLDVNTGLPRFNMPLELGLFFGCKRFGNESQSKKACMILDTELYRYRTFFSGISGQDIHAHDGDPDRAIIQ